MMGLAFSQKSLKLGKTKQSLLTCRLMKKSCKKLMKAGLMLKNKAPPILGNLAARINRYWKTESDNQTTVNFLKNQYLTPENCEELLIPRVNRELYVKLHLYHKRQDKKLTDLQETLLCAKTAVTNIANLMLEADKQSRMVNSSIEHGGTRPFSNIWYFCEVNLCVTILWYFCVGLLVAGVLYGSPCI